VRVCVCVCVCVCACVRTAYGALHDTFSNLIQALQLVFGSFMANAARILESQAYTLVNTVDGGRLLTPPDVHILVNMVFTLLGREAANNGLNPTLFTPAQRAAKILTFLTLHINTPIVQQYVDSVRYERQERDVKVQVELLLAGSVADGKRKFAAITPAAQGQAASAKTGTTSSPGAGSGCVKYLYDQKTKPKILPEPCLGWLNNYGKCAGQTVCAATKFKTGAPNPKPHAFDTKKNSAKPIAAFKEWAART
jgi:hypothetical protein